MDSFYDAPRRPPPTFPPRNRLSAPVVPEVSILCPPNEPANGFAPYKDWKSKQTPYNVANKENISQNTSYLKKQVRFESPVLQQITKDQILQTSHTSEVNVKEAPTFEQIYMANIPNRQLDLSVIDLPRKMPELGKQEQAVKSSEPPKTYREFVESRTSDDKIKYSDSVTDIFNYKRSPDTPTRNINYQNNNSGTPESRNVFEVFDKWKSREYLNLKTEDRQCNCRAKSSNEPSVQDLLKIISQQSQQIVQQNEQLLLLQKQVSTLLSRQNEQASRPVETGQGQYQYRFTSTQEAAHHKKGLPQFSILKSLEVSIRPQHNQNFNHEPKIEELSETESRSVDGSIMLDEPIKVQENCPSPDPTIHLGQGDMNDYEGSDDENSEINGTFYQNLMDHVNNILKKAHINAKDDPACKPTRPVKMSGKTLQKAKETTLRHLQSIGVDVPDFEDSSMSTSSSDDSGTYSNNDISFAVKQLLMKYLPNEHLAKVTCNKPTVPQENLRAIPNRPEFSFASVQYMKKYNLMASNPGTNRASPVSNKILDVTKLMQQPKLF